MAPPRRCTAQPSIYRSAAQPTAPGGRGGAVFYSAGDSPPTPRRCRVPEDRRSRLPPPALPHRIRPRLKAALSPQAHKPVPYLQSAAAFWKRAPAEPPAAPLGAGTLLPPSPRPPPAPLRPPEGRPAHVRIPPWLPVHTAPVAPDPIRQFAPTLPAPAAQARLQPWPAPLPPQRQTAPALLSVPLFPPGRGQVSDGILH